MHRPPYKKWFALMFDCAYSEIPDSPQFVRFLEHCLRKHPDKRIRYICAHHSNATMGSRLVSALIARAGDSREHPVVRGECLEQLSFNNGWPGPKNRIDRKAYRIVAQCLSDPDSYVRFHACYAAAHLRMHWVIPQLQALTVDESPAAMGVTVGFEATEAIKELRYGEGWRDGFPTSLPPASSYENLHINPYG